MSLPNFIGIGAQKAGTTTLHNILSQHPQILTPSVKEVHFFDREENYTKGIEWYRSVLPEKGKEEQLVGELTPGYMFFDFVPGRIFHKIGYRNLKLILILRDPVDRAYSHYLNRKKLGIENLSFQSAIEHEKSRIQRGVTFKKNYSYLTRSHYYDQIMNYLNYFPKENMCFLLFEKLYSNNYQEELKNIYDFLNIQSVIPQMDKSFNPTKLPQNKIISKLLYTNTPMLKRIRRSVIPSKKIRDYIIHLLSKRPERLSNELKQELKEKYFLKEIDYLEHLIERDLSIWKNSNH